MAAYCAARRVRPPDNGGRACARVASNNCSMAPASLQVLTDLQRPCSRHWCRSLNASRSVPVQCLAFFYLQVVGREPAAPGLGVRAVRFFWALPSCQADDVGRILGSQWVDPLVRHADGGNSLFLLARSPPRKRRRHRTLFQRLLEHAQCFNWMAARRVGEASHPGPHNFSFFFPQHDGARRQQAASGPVLGPRRISAVAAACRSRRPARARGPSARPRRACSGHAVRPRRRTVRQCGACHPERAAIPKWRDRPIIGVPP